MKLQEIQRLYEGYIGIIGYILGLYYIGIREKKMEATIVYRGSIGITEKKTQTTIVYRGYIGVMERKWKHLGKGHRKFSGLFRPLRNSESGEVLCWRMVPLYKTSAWYRMVTHCTLIVLFLGLMLTTIWILYSWPYKPGPRPHKTCSLLRNNFILYYSITLRDNKKDLIMGLKRLQKLKPPDWKVDR